MIIFYLFNHFYFYILQYLYIYIANCSNNQYKLLQFLRNTIKNLMQKLRKFEKIICIIFSFMINYIILDIETYFIHQQ